MSVLKESGKQAGFTLLEMMIVLTVIAFLLSAGISMVSTYRAQSRISITLAEMKDITELAEKARLLPAGNTYTRQGTAVIASFIASQGGDPGTTSTTVNRVNPDGNDYLITTQSVRVGIVETDLNELNLSPYGVNSSNVGTRSRLVAHFSTEFGSPQIKTSFWIKKIWYCEGYTLATKPVHCP